MPDSDVTKKEQRFLFSKGSPLDAAKKRKLADEMRHGAVKVRKKVRKGHSLNRGKKKRKKKRAK